MTITEFLIAILSAVVVSNIVCTRGLGIDSCLIASKDTKHFNSFALLICICIIVSSVIVYPLSNILVSNGLGFTAVLIYEIIIKIVCHFANKLFNNTDKDLYLMLSINAAVLGAVLSVTTASSFLEALALAIGSSLAYCVALKLFAGVRMRIEEKYVPKSFKGFPIELVAASIISLALYAFK